jgi:tRNA(His) guanylyltransferase
MDLGDRMKTYEAVPKTKLIRRMPVIIRVDGKAFHTVTRGLEKPFDVTFENIMNDAAAHTAINLQNCVFAYIQSDEVSFLLIDYKTLQTEPWFGNDLQKIVSISAATMSVFFNMEFQLQFDNVSVATDLFDSRAFNLTKEEVCNYFIWRQQDATRNSIQKLAQKYFSHKQLHKKSCNKLQDMLMLEKGVNWNNLPINLKRGRCITKTDRLWELDNDIPVFTQDRDYIEKFLETEDS